MVDPNDYTDELRLFKSLLIVTSLQERIDKKVLAIIENYKKELQWNLTDLLIAPEVWQYINNNNYDPKLVFCHPQLLLDHPNTSLYYRGLSGLSIKAAKDYFGAIENLEKNNPKARLSEEKALKMARVYNTFISSIIKNSTDWTLENGNRTLIATLGITLDGTMRNKVGDIAEERVRKIIVNWLIEQNLIISPVLTKEDLKDDLPTEYTLANGIIMRFSSEPDISFIENDQLVAVIEIKGGIDPAGALERYGAATKSFQHSVSISPRCKNFYLCAVYTPELKRRIEEDRLVEKDYNIIEILNDDSYRKNFITEIFHHTLRLV